MAAKKSHRPPRLSPPAALSPRPISHLVALAATLISVPGLLLYLAVLASLKLIPISLQGNLIAPLLLAFTGMGLWLLALTGLAASLWPLVRCKSLDSLMKVCAWANAAVLTGFLLLVIFLPQFE